jgi:hypothetical protein
MALLLIGLIIMAILWLKTQKNSAVYFAGGTLILLAVISLKFFIALELLDDSNTIRFISLLLYVSAFLMFCLSYNDILKVEISIYYPIGFWILSVSAISFIMFEMNKFEYLEHNYFYFAAFLPWLFYLMILAFYKNSTLNKSSLVILSLFWLLDIAYVIGYKFILPYINKYLGNFISWELLTWFELNAITKLVLILATFSLIVRTADELKEKVIGDHDIPEEILVFMDEYYERNIARTLINEQMDLWGIDNINYLSEDEKVDFAEKLITHVLLHKVSTARKGMVKAKLISTMGIDPEKYQNESFEGE